MGLANSPSYSITFINQLPPPNSGSFALFAGQNSLVWWAKFMNSGIGHQIPFRWQPEPCFVWGGPGELQGGDVFVPQQIVPADLTDQNQITLTYLNKTFNFIDQKPGSQPGSLFVSADGSIPSAVGSVGIGLAQRATFIVTAQPFMQYRFTPHLDYWCAFGDYRTGQMIDWEQVANKAQIHFGVNLYDLYAILTKDNTWLFKTNDEVNQLLSVARQQDPGVTLNQLDFSVTL
ncbi:hypothetical protein [Spirosoma validum]|uniref:Uncharacterized protein n=1 Tax=Spirosoma validum TaxID=2771355 RepID=A0A927GGM5_9BACT|nr:hypothetical protein [Spirosoma validum]MBD2757147.1 hypothetical protein [Spirosoma validum]